MANVEKNVFNIYGTSVAAVTTPKVYAYRGEYIWDDSNEIWELVTAAGFTVGSDNELTIEEIPNDTDIIGYSIDCSNLPVGGFDVVMLDDKTYVTGLRVYKTSHDVVRPIEELQN